MSSKRFSLFKIWDIVLIAALLLLIGLTLYFVLSSERGARAEVYENGKLTMTLELSKDREISLDHLTIVVREGTVSVKEADCPDKICEKRGAIGKVGESIVCLPARVVIRVVGKGEVEAIS